MPRVHGRGVFGIHHTLIWQLQPDRSEGARIVRKVRVQRRPHRECRVGVGVGGHHVDPHRRGARGAFEVDLDLALFRVDGDGGMQGDRLAARHVKAGFTVVGAAGQLADCVAGGGFRTCDDFFRQGRNIVEPVAVAQRVQPFGRDHA